MPLLQDEEDDKERHEAAYISALAAYQFDSTQFAESGTKLSLLRGRIKEGDFGLDYPRGIKGENWHT